MITLSEALKIAERHEHAKMYKYSESEEEYVFSSAEPGEIRYGYNPTVVSKINGNAHMYNRSEQDPWPYGNLKPIK